MYCHRHHHHCYQYHELVHFLYHSQVWVGNLIGGRDNTFDITTAAFSDEGAKLYDFPRNENCKLQYCNVEGLAWVDGGDQGGNGAAAAGEEEEAEGAVPGESVSVEAADAAAASRIRKLNRFPTSRSKSTVQVFVVWMLLRLCP